MEIVTKREFEQVVQQRFLRPMGMRGTTFQYDYDKGINAANGAYSTAADYMNFLSMLLGKGMFKGKRILSEKAVETLEQLQIDQAHVKFAPEVVKGASYAFGSWVLEQDANGKPTCFTSPSFTGIWPVLDICRGYASVIFVKSTDLDEKKVLFDEVKKIIDAQLPCGN